MEMEAGACFEIWLDKTLNEQEKYLLHEYNKYLHEYKFGYSFLYSFHAPEYSTAEKKQLLNTIGYVPSEVIYICGLATPLFRSIEAILKYFGGYAKISIGNALKDNDNNKRKSFTIRKKKYISKILISSSYQLINSEMVTFFFNYDDPPEIKMLYSVNNYLKESNKTHY
jgi:hypothetical protein